MDGESGVSSESLLANSTALAEPGSASDDVGHDGFRLHGSAAAGEGGGELSLAGQTDDAMIAAFTKAYVRRLNERRRAVCGFWIILFLLGLFFAPKFMQVVILVFEPPPGTPGHQATIKMNAQFPGVSHEWDAIVVLNTNDGKTPLLQFENASKAFIERLAEDIVTWGRETAEPETEFLVAHYFMLDELHAHTLAHSLLDTSDPANATAMIVSVHEKSGFEHGSMEGNKFSNWLDKKIENIRQEVGLPDMVNVRVTGMMAFCRDMQEGSERDMLKMDSLSFPFALAMLAYMLRSVRLLLIPLVNITIGLVVSFMLMYPVALSTRVIAVAPSVMMSVLVAFSIDYSLFLLSRFREEILKGCTVYDAVVLMVDSAGHTIMVSGATIAICWLGLLFFPVTLLSTIGLGAGLTVVIAFFVNISFTPVLLLTFPDFFTYFDNFGCGKRKQTTVGVSESNLSNHGHEDSELGQSQDNDNTRNLLGRQNSSSMRRMPSSVSAFESPCAFDAFGRRPILSPHVTASPANFATPGSVGTMRTPTLNQDGTVRGEVTSPLFGVVDPVEEINFLSENSDFFKCGSYFFGTKTRALASVIVVCAAILPLTGTALSFHHSESFKLFTPSDSVATNLAIDMEALYGGGRLAPYQLLIFPPNKTHVLSNKFYHETQSLFEQVILPLKYGENKPVALHAKDITGVMKMNGHNISFASLTGWSTVGCAVSLETVEMGLEICTNARCETEISACLADEHCQPHLDCLEHCIDDGTPKCLAKCASAGKIHPPSQRFWNLVSCGINRCVAHPFSGGKEDPGKQQDTKHDSPVARQLVGARRDLDCPSILVQLAQSVNGIVPSSTWVTMSLAIDPFSKDGTEWLDAVRIALDEHGARTGYRYYLTGGAVSGHDVVNKVFELYPVIMAIIIGAVFLLMGVSYRSVLVPVRAVFTILVTLILVYGLGVLTYEHRMLEWTHFHAFINPVGDSLSWLVPAMIAPVAIGLSLDYDIFLLTRIFEYRHAGFKTQDSILCGLAQTGGVITAAGIIMFFAFFGLALSSNASLNQMSFFLCVSVISDTFIIRTILVPAMMTLFQEANWWPSRPATLDY